MEQQQQQRFCTNCGQPLAQNMSFCGACGAAIGMSQQNSPGSFPPNSVPSYAQAPAQGVDDLLLAGMVFGSLGRRRRRFRRHSFGCLALVVVLVVLFFIVVSTTGSVQPIFIYVAAGFFAFLMLAYFLGLLLNRGER